MRYILVLIVLFFYNYTVKAQIIKPEKRIYIIDVTASMEGKGAGKSQNIFSKVKQNLKDAVLNIKEPNTEITLITFSDKVQSTYSGNSNNIDEVVKQIEKISVKKGNTNIIDAWKTGTKQINPSRTNIIFLLTDGLHNEGQPIDSLYTTLERWQNIADGHTYYGFYVMLTPEARQQKLYDVVDKTKQLYPIVSMNIGTSLISTPAIMNVNLNVGSMVSYRYKTNNGIPLPTDFSFNVVLKDNPYYDLVKNTVDKRKSTIYLQLKEKVEHTSIPIDYKLEFNYVYDKKKYPLAFFIPETFVLKTTNKGIRKMTLKVN